MKKLINYSKIVVISYLSFAGFFAFSINKETRILLDRHRLSLDFVESKVSELFSKHAIDLSAEHPISRAVQNQDLRHGVQLTVLNLFLSTGSDFFDLSKGRLAEEITSIIVSTHSNFQVQAWSFALNINKDALDQALPSDSQITFSPLVVISESIRLIQRQTQLYAFKELASLILNSGPSKFNLNTKLNLFYIVLNSKSQEQVTKLRETLNIARQNLSEPDSLLNSVKHFDQFFLTGESTPLRNKKSLIAFSQFIETFGDGAIDVFNINPDLPNLFFDIKNLSQSNVFENLLFDFAPHSKRTPRNPIDDTKLALLFNAAYSPFPGFGAAYFDNSEKEGVFSRLRADSITRELFFNMIKRHGWDTALSLSHLSDSTSNSHGPKVGTFSSISKKMGELCQRAMSALRK